MANVIQMGKSKADVQSEVMGDSHEQQTPAAAAAAVSATAADGDDVPGVPATLDAAEETNGVAAGDETVVDEVIDAADDFGGSRVVGREGSENGHDDEPPSRRGRRGRSRSRSRSRSRDRAGGGMNGDSSRDRGRRRDGDRDRERDRSRGRDRDPIGRDNRERGRDDSRDRNRGSDAARDRDRGREHSRERDRGRGSSRDRDRGRDERDRTRGRDRDSFDNTRDRARQSGGQGQGRRDRGQTAQMDGGRAGGRDPYRGRGLSNNGPMMQPMGGNLPMMQPMGVPGAPMFPPQGAGHGQMVFTTTQRPQPKLPGPHTRTYNILPMISFKAFMAEQRDDVTPEECNQRYDEYKADYVQRLTHSFIDVHCKEEWFLERYHPKKAESTRNAKLKWVEKESAVFGEQLRANPRLFIASASLDPISEEQRWGGMDKRKKRPRNSSREDASVDAMEEDLDQPGETMPQGDKDDGDADYDVDAKEISAHSDKVAFIRRIPAWVSTDELGRQIIEEAPQHERIVCSDAANTRNDDFARSAYIIYDTPEKATKAVQQLNKMRIYQNSKPKTKIAKKQSGDGRYFELKVFSYQPRSQNSVDHDFSTANRIAHDTKQSLKVAKALDEEFRRAESTDGITALLAEPEVQAALTSSSSGAAQLDLVCAYMKRVYFYVYYRGQQCRDEGDMIASRGAGRGVPAASKEEIQAAMSKADAVEGTNGNGVVEASVGSTDKGETGQTSRRGSGTESVDARSADRIKQAKNAEETRKKDQAFVERYDERVKAEVTKWQAMNTGRTDEGYARCVMPNCGKLFKAPEFVHKHLVNKHPEKYKLVLDQVADPFVRELLMADDNKPLPNIVADANTPPVVLLPGAMAMGGTLGAMPQGPPPMGAPGFPMMGGGMPMGMGGMMGPMVPGQMGGMGDFPMQMPMPPDAMMGSAGRGFRGRGGGGFRGRGGPGGRFGGRGMGRVDSMLEPTGPRDPRSLVSYVDVDAPKETTPNLDYGDAFPSKSKKKRKTM